MPNVPAGTSRDWLSRQLNFSSDDKLEIYGAVASSSQLRDATYWAEILFSAGIATLGLTLGSPAVIIGAMLISPLMGPILAGGLALAGGDFLLATRASVMMLLSAVLAIAFSTALVILLPFREMTAEIAARTHPNTLDLLIALLSGAVGALGICKSVRGVGTSIPGVAIAVALMPPLCVTGYGTGLMLTVDRAEGADVFRGGALLFVTNLVAITFDSMVVFLLLHVDAPAVRDKIRERRTADPELVLVERLVNRAIPGDLRRIGGLPARLFLIIGLLAIVFVPLKRSFDALSAEIRERQQINRVHKAATDIWESMFGRAAGKDARSYIDRVEASEHGARLHLNVRAFVADTITAEERDAYIRRLSASLGRAPASIDMSLVEIPTSRYRVEEGKIEPAAATTATLPIESIGARFRRVSQEALTNIRGANLPAGVTLADASLAFGESATVATLVYLATAPINEDARSILEADLQQSLDLPSLRVQLRWIPSSAEIAFAKDALAPEAAARLQQIGTAVAGEPSLHVTLGAAGAAAKHVETVRNALAQAGLDPSRIGVDGSAAVPAGRVIVTVSR